MRVRRPQISVAVPTALTGLLDWADLGTGTAKRKLANVHLVVMLAATTVFAAAWVAQRPGYDDGEVTTLGLLLGVGAFGLLILGGTLGGALAYVYGVRVVKRDVSVADALIPGRINDGPGRAPDCAPVVVAATPAAPEPVAAAGPSAPAEPIDPAAAAAYAGARAARYRL